jgi:uncharacterized protein YkwD
VLLASVVASAVALAGPTPPVPAAGTGALPPRTACRGQSNLTAPASVQLRAVRCLVNWVRNRAGLATVARNAELDRSAAMRARDIKRCQDFSHTPCGQPFITVFTAVHYFVGTAAVGENLAWGQGRLGTPRAAMANWLASPPHREILFTAKWRDLGIGRVRGTLFGRPNVTVWVAQFGRRGVATPLP